MTEGPRADTSTTVSKYKTVPISIVMVAKTTARRFMSLIRAVVY